MRLLKSSVLLSSLLLLHSVLLSQVVTTIPNPPLVDDTVTVIFDATEGDGGMAGFSGNVYAHTGVITTASTNPSDWKYVKAGWATTDPNVLMTPLGNDQYQLKYHIRNYYGIPTADTVLKLAFVFRNADGSVTGRDVGGGDIFVDVAQPVLSVAFSAPGNVQNVIDPNDPLNISVVASQATSLELRVNGSQVSQTTNATLSYTFQQSTTGPYQLEAIARDGTDSVSEVISVYVRNPNPPVAALPAGVRDGVNYINDSTVVLVLYAPDKNYAFLITSYNDWLLSSQNYMNRTPDGNRYWIELTGLTPGKEYVYQFLVDGELLIADYYAEKILDPWADQNIPAENYPNLLPYPYGKTNRIASVFQTAKPPYNWQVSNFQPPKKEDLVVYELLVRDFSEADNYQFVLDTLGYLEKLGINAIEFMPVNEFENNDSWGYNPSFHLALDKYYGTPEKFKELIDTCHARGIAVILDIVLNHAFGQSPMVELYWDGANNRPAANSPWFNQIPKHDFNVGYDFNHESQATKDYVFRTVKYWMEEYNVDGYRFDLSKGFTQKNTLGNVGAWGQYDADRVAILKNIADTVWSVNPDAFVILEHFSDNSEERELANYGLMFWGNSNHNYNEATMGYHDNGKSNFDWVSYKTRSWNDPNLLGYMESHDEERLMYKNLEYGNSSGSYSVKNTNTALKRVEMAATFFLPIPGPKMIWQFGELGYEVSIDFNGRTGRKPVRWEYFTYANRRHLYHVFASLAKLKKEEPAFETDNFSLNVGGALKTIHLYHNDMDVTILGNFDVVAGDINPNFPSTGTWYEFFSGDSLVVSNTTQLINLAPGEYRLYSTKKLDRTVITTDLEELTPGNNSYLSVYPNPVQEDVNISFQLSAPTLVGIDVLDLSGKKVTQVYRGKRNAGLQQIGFNVQQAGLSPGIYLVRIQANGKQATSKLVVR